MTPPMLTAALALAATGWRVHPLAGKAPRLSNGVNGATTDPDTIRAWWTRWPDANMGARVPAGIVVVDVDDVAALEAVEATHGPIPPTLTVWSGRGDGARHLYLRRPPGQLVGKLAGGIDIKRDNAYMVMPPSRHPDTGATYRWERR